MIAGIAQDEPGAPLIASLSTAFGLLLTLVGAWRAATSVVLGEDEAIAIGLPRWASHDREENLRAPAVRNLLQASRGARQGFCLIAVGTAFQILPIAVGLVWAPSALAEGQSQTYTLYRNSLAEPTMRVHVASFDTNNGGDYNSENCEVAANLFQTQDGVKTRFWCEPGPFRR